MKAKVYITLKNGVHDPQGEAVLGTLKHLGFSGVHHVRVGKYIELDVESADQIKGMCEKLLANTVIESYRFEVE